MAWKWCQWQWNSFSFLLCMLPGMDAPLTSSVVLEFLLNMNYTFDKKMKKMYRHISKVESKNSGIILNESKNSGIIKMKYCLYSIYLKCICLILVHAVVYEIIWVSAVFITFLCPCGLFQVFQFTLQVTWWLKIVCRCVWFPSETFL